MYNKFNLYLSFYQVVLYIVLLSIATAIILYLLTKCAPKVKEIKE